MDSPGRHPALEPSRSLELLMADLAAMVRDAGDAYGDGSEGSTPIELRRDSMARFETSLQTADDTVRLLPDPTGLKGLKGLKAAPPTRSAYMKRAIYIEPDGGEPPTVAYVRKVRVNPVGATPVSYTHLTLPTKRIV